MSSRPVVERTDGVILVAVAGVVLLVTVFALLLLQIAIPGWASAFAVKNPEVADLVDPYSAAAIAFVACFQVALLVAWRMAWLSIDGRGRTRGAVRCADVIVVCAGIATVLTIVVGAHVARHTPGGPSLLYIYLTAIIGTVVSLFLVRWRRRLASEVSRMDPTGRT
jgi:cytochrome bd-type quinol oxidase subunit 2